MAQDWLEFQIKSAKPFHAAVAEYELVEKLVELVLSNDLGLYAHAAAFDLLSYAAYYDVIDSQGWLYCPHHNYAVYPYTNICPYCNLEGRFYFHPANKPLSGQIGTITRRLLALYLQTYLNKMKRPIRVLKGAEPIDLICIDEAENPPVIYLTEVKAAPLLTLPLAIKVAEKPHNSHLALDIELPTSLSLFLPVHDKTTQQWSWKAYNLGENNYPLWSYTAIARLLERDDFIQHYFSFWHEAIQVYENQNKRNRIFWLTNACGQPVPRPNDWLSRGTGYESVSDNKTSVGMDRTDDIKKAIYQVFKLSVEAKGRSKYRVLTGITSNIHAIRHFNEYLTQFIDIMWLKSQENLTVVADLEQNTAIFNLFDGIVCLTKTLARDKWIERNFDFGANYD